MNLQDVVDIDILQKIQDAFAESTGFAAITVDFRGKPITEYSNFSPFCKLVRNHPQFVEICYKCDAFGGLEAARKGTSHIYRCHAGLVDFAVPIMVKGQYLGSMMVGQVKVRQEEKEGLDFIVQKTPLLSEDPELRSLYNNIPVIPLHKIKAAADLMFHVINNLFEKDFQNFAQEELLRKNEQLIEQLKSQLESAQVFSGNNRQSARMLINPHFYFNAMNMMSCMAIMENAEKTQEIVMILTEIMKYVLLTDEDLVPLKKELAYIKNYLRLQELRLGDRLNVSIDIPVRYHDVRIPPFIFQAVVDNAVIHGIEPAEGAGAIQIGAYREGGDLILAVADNGTGIPFEKKQEIFQNRQEPTSEGNIKGLGLHAVNQILTEHFGFDYKLMISANEEGGTTVRIKIPLPEGGGSRFA